MKNVTRKINDEELLKLKTVTNDIQQLKQSLADVEMHKHSIVQRIVGAENALQKQQAELMEKYGKVTVNLKDGTIQEPEVEPEAGPTLVEDVDFAELEEDGSNS